MTGETSMNLILDILKDHLKQSLAEIAKDPLLECLRNTEESRTFMLDRIQEIISDSISLANDNSIQALLRQIVDMRTKIAMLEEQNKESNNSILEIKKLKLENSTLQKKIDSLQFQISEISNPKPDPYIDTLLAEKSELKKAMESLESKTHNLIGVSEAKQKEIDILQNDQISLKMEVNELRIKLKKSADELSMLHVKTADTASRMVTRMDQLEHLQVSQEKEVHYKEQIIKLTSRFKEIKEKYALNVQKLKESHRQNNELNRLVDEYRDQLDEVEHITISLKSRFSSQEQTIEELKQSNKQQQKTIDFLKTTVCRDLMI